MRACFVSLVLLASLSSSASAQRLEPVWTPSPPPFASTATRQAAQSEDRSGSRALGGLLGATAGFFVVGVMGAAIDRGFAKSYCEDFCGLGGFVIGATVGESFGMVGGMALGGPGSRPSDLLISTGIAVAGILAAIATNEIYVLAAVPIAQLVVLLGPDRRAAAAAAPN